MNTQDHNEINVGIDTGQACLDVFIRPSGEMETFQNNPDGIRKAIRFTR